MLQRVVCTGLLLLLAVGGVTAGDLYLLKIENAAQLEAAERILPSAHGVLGERFLVDMTDSYRIGIISRRGCAPGRP